jgi:hypothetical protein
VIPSSQCALTFSDVSAKITVVALTKSAAAALTTPLDVVKTRLQTEGVMSATRYNSTAVVGQGRALAVVV